jgi:hypothetical protein
MIPRPDHIRVMERPRTREENLSPTAGKGDTPPKNQNLPQGGQVGRWVGGSHVLGMRTLADIGGHWRNIADVNTYTPKEFAGQIKRTTRTLRRWAEQGLLVPARTPSGRPIYTDEHLRIALDMDAPEPKAKTPKGKS